MFVPGRTDQVFIATGATDLRKSINGLSLLVAGQLALNPLSGSLFCFCNRKRDMVKILYWDRNGFCLWHKRLERDRFPWPNSTEEALAVQGHKLTWLLDGLHLEQSQAHAALPYSTVA